MSVETERKMIKYWKDVVQGSQEWLDLRTGRVTCSNALAVMNRGVRACLIENERAAKRLKPNGNAYAERGHVIEHEYKQEFNKVLEAQGLQLEECGFITNDDYPLAGYSPDGLIVNDEGKIETFAEFKAYNDVTVDQFTHKVKYPMKHRSSCRNLMDVPPECIAQCNMAMVLTGTNYMYLFLCNPDAAKTNQNIEKLLAQAERGDKVSQAILKKVIPDGDYNWPVPVTHVHLIERDERICKRIIAGLNR